MLDNGHNKERLAYKSGQIWFLSLKGTELCLYPSYACELCQPCKTYYNLILLSDVASFFDTCNEILSL